MRHWLHKRSKHLYLLLWRNSVIRWRVGSVTVAKKYRIPLFQLMEILWPLLLYLIMAILAHKFPPKQEGDTIYRPYAMPSAGFLPFLQTLMCDLGDDDKGGVVSDLPTFPNATLNELYPVLDEVGSWNVSWTKLCDSFHSLAAQRNCLATVTNQDPRCQDISTSTEVPLTCYLRNATEFSLFLETDLELRPGLVQQIMAATVDPTMLPGNGGGIPDGLGSAIGGVDLAALLGLAGGVVGGGDGGLLPVLPGVTSGESLEYLVCNTSSLATIIHFPNLTLSEVQSEVCGLSDSQWQELAQQIQKQSVSGCDSTVLSETVVQVVSIQKLLEESGFVEVLRSFASVSEGTDGEGGASGCYEDEDGQFNCTGGGVKFFCGTSRDGYGRDVKTILGRFFTTNSTEDSEATPATNTGNGTSMSSSRAVKVLYSPVTNITTGIMKKANRTFETVAQLISLADQVKNCSQFFLDNFDPDSLSGARQALSGVIAYRNGVPGSSIGTRYLANLYPNVSVSDLQQALDFINASSSNNIWSVMRTVRGVATQAYDALTLLNWDIFMGMPSEDAMVTLFSDPQQQKELGIDYLMAGVVFDDPLPTNTGQGAAFKNVTIRIRTNFSAVVDPTELMDVIWHPGPEEAWWKKLYFSGLFIFLQDMIERATIEEIVGHRVASPGVYVQHMPYPCYVRNRFVGSLQVVLPLAMLFSWLFPVAMTTRAVVREKEVRLKEFMKMMGVGEGLLRLSWFLNSFFVLELSVVCIVVIMKYGGILPASNPFLIFLYLTMYALSMLSYSFLVSVFFINANLAACVAALSYFMVFFAHLPIIPYFSSISAPVLALCCVWSPLAFAIGATYIAQWELQQAGLQWHNVLTTPIIDDHLAFVGIATMLLVDMILYLALAWYIEGVFPGRYGVAKPWYFPFQPSYWCGQGKYTCHTHFLNWCSNLWGRGQGDKMTLLQDEQECTKLTDSGVPEEGEVHEEDEPTGLPLGIAIQELNKTFKTGWLPWKRHKVQAVSNLSMRFYEGQITAFLGHNGAGKTTTLSILTGLFEPTSGTAHVYGHNIRTDMDWIRHSLGICPQHNILFDELSVEEHFMFYGQLKGLTRSEAKQQLPEWLEKVELRGHGDKLAKHLSGGMKRKLSILLAFVGQCQTIILDEPTAGVDPFARRQIWDFLLRNKEGRTVVLCTHHMDEAEMLGDRIAIISQGSLLCCGTFEYLKHRYGRGHRLTLVTRSPAMSSVTNKSSHTFTVVADVEDVDFDPSHEHSDASQTDGPRPLSPSSMSRPLSPSSMPRPLSPPSMPRPSSLVKASRSPSPEECTHEVMSFLRQQIAGAELVEMRGRELHVLLPLLQSRPRVLAQLFAELDNRKEELDIASYGLTACSMEEIFMQLTQKELLDNSKANLAETYVPRASLHSDSGTSYDSAIYTQSHDTVDSSATQGSNPSRPEELTEGETLLEDATMFGDESGDGLLGNQQSSHDSTTRLRLCLLQFYASIVRRVLHTRGAVVALLVQNVLPLLVVLVGLIIAMGLHSVPDSPRLELSPQMFFTGSKYEYMFVGGVYNNVTAPMADSFFRPCGIAATQVGPSWDPASPCYYDDQWTSQDHSCPAANYPQNQYGCACPSELEYSCNVSSLVASGVPDCFNGTVTGTRVINVTLPDTANFTEELQNYLLRSTYSFVRERYGGASFGHIKEMVEEVVDNLNSDPSLTLPFLAVRKAAKAWHTLKGYHAGPAYLNTLNNAILRGMLDNTSRREQSEYGVRTFSHPFALTDLEKIIYAVRENVVFLVHPLSVVFALGFVLAGFSLLLIEERALGIKHLQLVCGMSRWVYWMCAYVWDSLWYLAFCVVMVLVFIAFREPTYSSLNNLPIFLLILLFYGLAAIPWIYMFSFLFRSPATAYVLLFCLNFFSGFAFLLVDFILVQLDEGLSTAGLLQYTLVWVPFPAYALGRCMMYLSLDLPVNQFISSFDDSLVRSPYSQLFPFFLSLILQSVLYTLVVIAVETSPYLVNKIIGRRRVSLPQPEGEDDEVLKERATVLQDTNTQDDLLVLRNLTKIYGTRCSSQHRLAVNQLCLRMEKGECFGLLGVNGAGKTTTFRMLTGDTRMTCGDATIGSTSLSSSGSSSSGQVGYCPQVDALMDSLTGRQQLVFYSRLRGMRGTEQREVVEWTLNQLQLKEHADKPSGTYSGGNRRKLSTAIALLSRPSLILLDEPTSGVDPLARRFLWSVVRGVVSKGQSVVLTTHSMAECEALCSRVGIMVNGSFRCLGSVQQLKTMYGEGYRLKIRVNSNIQQVKEFVQHNIAKAILKEEHITSLVYQLPGDELHLSSVYDTMEDARLSLDIKDYSLSQTTLDDVFIHFANEQSEEAGLKGVGHKGEGLSSSRNNDTGPTVTSSDSTSVTIATLPDLVPSSVETTAV